MDPELTQTAAAVECRLRERFPGAPAAVVHACVEAAASDCADARVRHFLGILIERKASDALRSLPLRGQPDDVARSR